MNVFVKKIKTKLNITNDICDCQMGSAWQRNMSPESQNFHTLCILSYSSFLPGLFWVFCI